MRSTNHQKKGPEGLKKLNILQKIRQLIFY